MLGVGLHGGDRALPRPAPSSAATHDTVTTCRQPSRCRRCRSVPVRLRIPALGMSVPLLSLGENADGTVQVPPNDLEPGWFNLGPTPGQIGSSVILGHVDNSSGPGVFFTLRTLAAGDPIFVDQSDGGTVEFVVNAVASYDKTSFPAQRVYGSHGSSALQLVTCGGIFDHATGSYLSNIVAYSSLVAVTPPPVPTH